MSGIIDRLEQFMDSKGINNNRMTVQAGLSIGLIGSARKKKAGLHSDNVEKILKAYPELNPGWLITGRGSMFRNEYSGIEESVSVVEDPQEEYASLVKELRETISVLKEQLAEAKKDRELLRKILSEKYPQSGQV
ncbi:MAG: hypothetical protein PVF73_08560 [Bacteroidales bacterium]|jgi:hypothetical protein